MKTKFLVSFLVVAGLSFLASQSQAQTASNLIASCSNNAGYAVAISNTPQGLIAEVIKRNVSGQGGAFYSTYFDRLKMASVTETTTRGPNRLFVGQGFELGIVIPLTGIPTRTFEGSFRAMTDSTPQVLVDQEVACSL